MRRAPTKLPTACISKDGYPAPRVREGPSLMKSAHVMVLAGSWITVLHGIRIGPSFRVRVPPKRCGSVVFAQVALVASTVAVWMNPVSSKPWISAASTEVNGSGNVAVTNGATAPGGGLAVPPWAKAFTLSGTATSRLSTVSMLRTVAGLAAAAAVRFRQTKLITGNLLKGPTGIIGLTKRNLLPSVRWRGCENLGSRPSDP